MLTEDLRNELKEKIKKDPRSAVKIIKQEPKILEILLNAEDKILKERNEKIKYINMTVQMEEQLKETAQNLKTTQGLLIGAGILFLLMLLEDR